MAEKKLKEMTYVYGFDMSNGFTYIGSSYEVHLHRPHHTKGDKSDIIIDQVSVHHDTGDYCEIPKKKF